MYSGTVIKPYWSFEVGEKYILKNQILCSDGARIFTGQKNWIHLF